MKATTWEFDRCLYWDETWIMDDSILACELPTSASFHSWMRNERESREFKERTKNRQSQKTQRKARASNDVREVTETAMPIDQAAAHESISWHNAAHFTDERIRRQMEYGREILKQFHAAIK